MTTSLIIDDIFSNIELMKAYLHAFNMDTITATTGKDGFELAKLHTPDIIFIDLLMPDSTWNGYQTIENLKQHPQTSDIPIIAVTGASEYQRAYELGCESVLTRPFQKQNLYEGLHRLGII